MFTVITTYKMFGQQAFTCSKRFDDREAALDYIVEETFQDDVVLVQCPEMDLEEVGV